ncbi:NAD kinase [Massilia sp. TS11]|uniref:NAD kinase n=1 Tax=Massilia sp. TS11 TaxID=2908003 RepID=UPI001EDC01FC|nr:NAD kinase [Massilia sp. TS11]MCG2586333.1 NAD kinase [Massilia sp. TS11]
MNSTPATIALVVRPNTDGIEARLAGVVEFLRSAGYRVVLEADTASHLGQAGLEVATAEQIGHSASAAVVMGGDGTMLGIARQLAPYGVPLIGINQGRLGFMTDIPIEQMLPALGAILSGKAKKEKRTLLQGRVERAGQVMGQGLAVNDVVLARGAGAGMVELAVTVDGQFMYRQRSDGLIITTPTGSTAYALSAGGALLHPALGGIGLVPIAPHALSNRPIVVPDSSEIAVEILGGRDTTLNFDFQTFENLQHGDRIIVERSPHTVTFLHPEDWNYYHTLREKLHWNESRH